MKKLAFVAIVGIALTFSKQAEAVFIVDTGAGNLTGGANLYNASVTNNQFLAGQFTTTETWNLNSLEGWIRSTNSGGTVDAVLLFDNAGIPDLVGEFFRQSFVVPGTGSPTGSVTAWRGVTGLDYVLNPGTYWLALEAVNPTLVDNLFMPVGVSSGLSAYAANGIGTGNNWIAANPTPEGWGFRIDADRVPTGAVPEPMSTMLFGTGLVGAAIRKRFLV